MHIKTIFGDGIKGKKFTHEIEPVTIFTGENGVGKTARLDAIRLSLLGYLPRLGKQASSTFALSNAKSMETWVVLSDGRKFSRAWSQERGKSVVYRGYEGEPLVPEIAIDGRDFFGIKTSNKRIEYLFGQVKAAKELSPDAMIADIKNLTFNPTTEDHQAQVREIVESIMESASSWNSIREEDPTQTFQVWLDDLVNSHSERLKLEKQNVDRMSKTIAGGVQLNERCTTDLPTLEARRDQISARISEIEKAESAQYSANQERRNNLARRQQLMAHLQGFPVIPDGIIELHLDAKMEVERLRTLIADTKSNIQAAQRNVLLIEEINNKKRRIDQINASMIHINLDVKEMYQSAVSGYESKTSEISKSLMEAEATADHARKDIDSLGKSREASMAKLGALLKSNKCPTCGSEGSSFDEAIRSIRSQQEAEHKARLDSLNESLRLLDSTVETLSKRRESSLNLDDVIARYRANLDRILSDESKNKSLITELHDLSSSIEVLQNSVYGTETLDIPKAESELVTHQAEFAKLTSVLSERERLLDFHRRKLATKEALDSIPMDPVIEPIPNAELPALRTNLEEVHTQIKQAAAEIQNENLRRKAECEFNAGNARLEVMKAVIGVLKEYRAKVVDNIVGPLVQQVSRFTRPISGFDVEYRDGEIGYQGFGKFITMDLFSGTQEAVASAAFQLALASESALKIVIFDELGRLSDNSKASLLDTVFKLIASKVIDQFIGVDVAQRPYVDLQATVGFCLIPVE